MPLRTTRLAAFGLAVVAATGGVAPGPASAAEPEVLASACSGCHSTSDKLTTLIPKIRGLPEVLLIEMMRAFRAGQKPATVMDRIAKGYTEDEIKQLAAFFAALK